MSFPVTIDFFGQKLMLHSLLEWLAFFTGFRYYIFLRRRRRDPIISNNRIWILIGAIFGALLGSRVLGGLENPSGIQNAKAAFLHFYQNKTVLGGFLGGLLGVELIKKIIGEKNPSGDLFTYPIILALIIGRIGCFSMGVHEATYGTATDFIAGMDLGDGQKRHAVTLYEIFFLIALWTGLKIFEKRLTYAPGALFKIFMIDYCLFRFLLDFIKPHYNYPPGISAIQFAALLGLIYYLPFIIQPGKLLKAHA